MISAPGLELRGPMKALYRLPTMMSHGKPIREILVESPAGTGKSLGNAATIVEWCRDWPGSRFVVFRQERKRLAETWQTTFERHVCPYYGINPGSGSLLHKRGYTIPCPDGGTSEILLGGLDDPLKWFSFEATAALFVEANEISLETYETLFRALRWPHGMPYHFTVLECNPDSPLHWIYKRFGLTQGHEVTKTPGRIALHASHRHNPAYWDEDKQDFTPEGQSFIDGLRLMSGVRFRRLYEGVWCSAEGAIYEHFDPAKHIIGGQLVKDGAVWFLVDGAKRRQIHGFFASMDWGMQAPGCFGVWAVDAQGRMILVAEWYHTGWNDNTWADIAAAAVEKYGITRIVCDSADKSAISTFNDRLTPIGGRAGHRIAVEADKSVLTGISMVHDKLGCMIDGEPSILFLASSLQHAPDPSLVGKAPVRTTEEIPGYVWEDTDPDKPFLREKPRKINDHGVDQMRYASLWRWGVDFKPAAEPVKSRPGSMGQAMGFDDELRKARRWTPEA